MTVPDKTPVKPELSVVIPALNEAMNIVALIDEIAGAVTPVTSAFEIVVVDDGSDDATGDRALGRRKTGVPVRVLRHPRRYGQSAAIRSGVGAARYPWIATLDGDGQNDPADIPALLQSALALEPPGLTGGIRHKRQDGWGKRWGSKLANALRQAMLQDGCPDSGCGLKVFPREAFLRLPYFNAMHRFLPALFRIHGHPTAFQPVNHRPRQGGRSKYGQLKRAGVGLLDLVGVTWLRLRTRVARAEERRHLTGSDGSDVQSG